MGEIMPKSGAFTFVLHSHLPYARSAGRWPHGEEWVHEALAETYIPLLNALTDLYESGVGVRITIGLTPILSEQLADDAIKSNFLDYLDQKIDAASADVPRFEKLGDAQGKFLAGYYRDGYAGIKSSFVDRYGQDILGGFRRLQDAGVIEIITCAATHGYLPLLSCDTSIRAQLRAGVESYKRHFGRAPRAIWLPECAYRPAYLQNGEIVRPGIESFLAEQGLKLFFGETHTVEGGRPVGKAAGDAIGPYGDIVRRYVVPPGETIEPTHRTTYRPYYVLKTETNTKVRSSEAEHSGVSVIGRNNLTGLQVWSAEWGYPGDYDYREFHKKDGTSGMQYWRVTGARVDLGMKDYYHPDRAAHKVGEHARHFAWLVSDLLSQVAAENDGQFGIIAANYDTELFGHWWFEGVEWIKQVLANLAASDKVELMTASDYLEAHPPTEVLSLPEGSWGQGGGHFVWDNVDTHWMWKPIHKAESRMERLVARKDGRTEDEELVLKQAARELLLLQASDWPFLVTTGQAKEYAVHRFAQHVERFDALADSLERGQPDVALAEELWERDKVFPDVDWRWWT